MNMLVSEQQLIMSIFVHWNHISAVTTDSSCHSTERHRKVGHFLAFALIILLSAKRMKSELHDVVSQYSCLQKVTILSSTGHQQNLDALYLIFFSLHAQFFNQSKHFHLSWELYGLK